jgi:hypothetical protein
MFESRAFQAFAMRVHRVEPEEAQWSGCKHHSEEGSQRPPRCSWYYINLYRINVQKFDWPGLKAKTVHFAIRASRASCGLTRFRPPTAFFRQHVFHATLARVQVVVFDQKNVRILLVI